MATAIFQAEGEPMNYAAFKKIRDSNELTQAEKMYIFDVQYRMGGSFTIALFNAIAAADQENRRRLGLAFPEEVAAYVAWTEGDLHERASRIAGGDVGYVTDGEKPKEKS